MLAVLEKRYRRIKELWAEAVQELKNSPIPAAFSVFNKGAKGYVNMVTSDGETFEIMSDSDMVKIVLKDSALGLKLYKLNEARHKAHTARYKEFVNEMKKRHEEAKSLNKKYKKPTGKMQFATRPLGEDLVGLYVSLPVTKRGEIVYVWTFQSYRIPSLDTQGLDYPLLEEVDDSAGDSASDNAA